MHLMYFFWQMYETLWENNISTKIKVKLGKFQIFYEYRISFWSNLAKSFLVVKYSQFWTFNIPIFRGISEILATRLNSPFSVETHQIFSNFRFLQWWDSSKFSEMTTSIPAFERSLICVILMKENESKFCEAPIK